MWPLQAAAEHAGPGLQRPGEIMPTSVCKHTDGLRCRRCAPSALRGQEIPGGVLPPQTAEDAGAQLRHRPRHRQQGRLRRHPVGNAGGGVLLIPWQQLRWRQRRRPRRRRRQTAMICRGACYVLSSSVYCWRRSFTDAVAPAAASAESHDFERRPSFAVAWWGAPAA